MIASGCRLCYIETIIHRYKGTIKWDFGCQACNIYTKYSCKQKFPENHSDDFCVKVANDHPEFEMIYWLIHLNYRLLLIFDFASVTFVESFCMSFCIRIRIKLNLKKREMSINSGIRMRIYPFRILRKEFIEISDLSYFHIFQCYQNYSFNLPKLSFGGINGISV